MKDRPKRLTDYRWLPKLTQGLDTGRLEAFLDLIADDADVDPKYKRPEILAISLGALQFPFVHEARAAADVGAGYGHPGLVLACVLPATTFHLIEPKSERSEWLTSAVAELALENVSVVPHAAELWGRRECDVVTVKNVAALNTMVEWVAPLLRLDGRAVVWMRRLEGDERRDGLYAASVLGLELERRRRAHKLTRDGGRLLLVMRKTGRTPARFPRGPKEAWRDPITRDFF